MTDLITATSPAAIASAAHPKTGKTKRPRRMAREPEQGSAAASAAAPKAQPPSKPKGPSKSDAVIALLSREEGATCAELIAATGWLAHTMRAALTGLRKKGHVIERSKRGEETCYRIAEAG